MMTVGASSQNGNSGRDARTEPEAPPSRDVWQSTFDAVSDSVWVLDASQRIVRCNRASCALFGLGPEEMIGRHCWEIVHGTPEPIPQCPVLRMRSSRRRESMELAVNDRWYHVTVDPLVSDSREPCGAVHIIRDITDRKRTEHDLAKLGKESEHRFRTIFENATDGIVIADTETLRFVAANTMACRMLGCTSDDVTELGVADVHPEDDLPRVLDVFQRLMAGEFSLAPDIPVLRRDGSVIYADINSFPIVIDGRPCLVGIFRDTTKRRRTEQALLESQVQLRKLAGKLATMRDEERGRIARGLHDDVAQVLAACRIKLAALRPGLAGPDDSALGCEIDELLKEANAKVRALSFELGSVTLRRLGLVEAIAELCENMGRRWHVSFEFSADDAPKPLSEEAAVVLFEATRELLFNVKKHAGVNAAQVSVGRRGDEICVMVRDNGTGFAAKALPGASGLGLFGIRERLQSIGGRLVIDSEPGSYTDARLCAPLTRNT